MPELSTTSVSLLSPRPSPSPHWQLPTLEMVVSPGQKIVPVRPKGQLHHPKPAKASLGQWKVQAATWREACWAEGLPEGEEEKGPWVFSHRPAYLPCKGLGLEVRVGASATPGCSPHTCRPLCASFFSLSVELPSEASPRAPYQSRAGLAPPQGVLALGAGSNSQHRGGWWHSRGSSGALPVLPVSTGSKWGLWTQDHTKGPVTWREARCKREKPPICVPLPEPSLISNLS